MADEFDRFRQPPRPPGPPGAPEDEFERFRQPPAAGGWSLGASGDRRGAPALAGVATRLPPPAPPGSIENPLPEQHPEISGSLRARLMYGSPTSEAAAENLRRMGFEAEDLGGFHVAVRRPGEQSYHRLDPPGFDWQDLLDIAGDVQDIGFMTAGALLAGAKGTAVAPGPGTIIGGMAGGAAGGATSRALRASEAFVDPAIEFQPIETGKAMLWGAGEGAAGELLGPVVAGIGRGLRLGGKALQAPQKIIEGVTGEGGLVRAADLRRRLTARVQTAQARTRPALAAEAEAKAALEAAKLRAEGELLERAGQTGETAARGRKVAEEIRAATPPVAAATPRVAPSPSPATAGIVTPVERSRSSLLAGILDPAYGITAKHLKALPELESLLRRHVPEIVPELGSRAMGVRDRVLAALEARLGPGPFKGKMEALNADLAEWMLGSAKFQGLTQEARESLARLAAGAGDRQAQGILEDALVELLKKGQLPDYLIEARRTLRQTRGPASAARALRQREAVGIEGRRAEISRAIAGMGPRRGLSLLYRAGTGQAPGMLGKAIRLGPRALELAGVGVERAGKGLERRARLLWPGQLPADAGPALRRMRLLFPVARQTAGTAGGAEIRGRYGRK